MQKAHETASLRSGSGGLLDWVGGRRAVLLASFGISLSVECVLLLTGAVNGNLDGEFASINLLSIHFRNGLLLKLLGRHSNKSKATSLAGLVASLELFDHEAWDGTESEFSGGRRVVLEDLEKLGQVSGSARASGWDRKHLLLGEVIG